MRLEAVEIPFMKHFENYISFCIADYSEENWVVHRYTMPSSVPTRNFVSSSGLKEMVRPLSRVAIFFITLHSKIVLNLLIPLGFPHLRYFGGFL